MTETLIMELKIGEKFIGFAQEILPYLDAVQSYKIAEPMQLLHRLFIEILM